MNFRNSKGESLADIVNRVGKRVIRESSEKLTKSITASAREEIVNLSNWDVGKLGPGDLDLTVSPKHDPLNRGGNMSIRQAITADVDNPSIVQGLNSIDISFGHISSLLAMSPRTLYYEFGTLGYSEVHETGNLTQYNISDFDVWQNPYIEPSELRKTDRINQWGFRPDSGKGRFGVGYMVPAGGSVQPFAGIPPVRMYRNAFAPAVNRVTQSFSGIMNQIKTEMGLT